MKFKPNVSITYFRAPIIVAMQVVENTAPGGYEPTTTSGEDGVHGHGSLHPSGYAIDIRVRDYPGYNMAKFEETRRVIDDWIARIYLELPANQYDIVFGDHKHRNHIHLEFDPE